ncbi:hypothetical protein E3O25_02665 [Cryobacterium sp. TMT1-3]|uniref:Uncharacterized protein n=1 Tax=Cryobacterium luteum TaxID=1424661 RepID=A0A5F0DES4_9MICO|nr:MULTISPECIES: hypothetical protein [Cryobacterium]TFB95484.1 hypothetical protein E3O10_00045 [Cryobacterium luteum]TFC31366.1 hypothetical protein E3O25_02665 [Cryobacterium sp. TMT1-3]
MTKSIIACLAILGIMFLTACGGRAPSSTPSPTDGSGSREITVPTDEPPTKEFWTDERLRSATPMPMPPAK